MTFVSFQMHPTDEHSLAQTYHGHYLAKECFSECDAGNFLIKLAKTSAEAAEVAGHILGTQVKGLKVKKVLADAAADIRTELYLGAVLDRARR